MIQSILHWNQRTVLFGAAVLIALVALTDWQVEINATLGFLYIFPLVLLGTVCNSWQLVLAALFCTLLSDRLDPFTSDMPVPRDSLIFLTLAVTGLLSRDVSRGYRRELDEVVARRTAEEQLEFLVDNSPAAILTMTASGQILMANPAAHRLFGVSPGSLRGKRISRYIPALGNVPSIDVPSIDESVKFFRAEMQTRGQRDTGEVFLTNVFFSTYQTAAGPRLAALLVDSSEHLREREEASLEQLLAGSRILVAAVSHEVRNVCGAIGLMYENLARHGNLNGNQDFEALGSLVEMLARIASLELKQSTSRAPRGWISLQDVLTDLRIVLEPQCEESETELLWDIPESLPLVQADRHSLLQVFLNLARNSLRALETAERKVIHISVATLPNAVTVRLADSGPGIPPGQKLFQPLQEGAEATGLGLYLSRAFMRSFRGELRHDPTETGCSFVLELVAQTENEASLQQATVQNDAAPATLTA